MSVATEDKLFFTHYVLQHSTVPFCELVWHITETLLLLTELTVDRGADIV